MINIAQNRFAEMDNSEASIIKTLLYFDIFSYPLLKEEIIKFSNLSKINSDKIASILNKLVAQKYIFKHEKFYSLNDEANDVNKRLKGNKQSEIFLKKAKLISLFIGYFPFVRGVFISGTLSKGYADKDSDIDFFIITKPGRLWVARTFLTVFKKIFLLNSKKYFCINYFIDSNHLEISDKNMYTAVELLTLLPMYNFELFEKFIAANNWTENYLPNYKINKSKHGNYTSTKDGFIKTIIERLLSGKIGEWMDNLFLNITLNRLKRKFSYLDKEEFELALKSKKYISKHHPKNYQKYILKKVKEKMEMFENEFNISL